MLINKVQIKKEGTDEKMPTASNLVTSAAFNTTIVEVEKIKYQMLVNQLLILLLIQNWIN